MPDDRRVLLIGAVGQEPWSILSGMNRDRGSTQRKAPRLGRRGQGIQTEETPAASACTAGESIVVLATGRDQLVQRRLGNDHHFLPAA
jgi:hypothetical protein